MMPLTSLTRAFTDCITCVIQSSGNKAFSSLYEDSSLLSSINLSLFFLLKSRYYFYYDG